MMEEIFPHVYRSEIPLPNSPLRSLNAYIIQGGDRFLIVDTGFNCDVCLNAMNASLQSLGIDPTRADYFITHLHVDHIGLVGTLVRAGSKIYFNELEARKLDAGDDRKKSDWQKMMDIYTANGFDPEGVRIAMASHPVHRYGLKERIAFTRVNEGDGIDVGDFHFKCLATPGHSPGHMSLYEANNKMLIAGDHILYDITPNIAFWLEMEDSLGQYLASLEKVNALEVKMVLTGHRRLVHDLRGRIGELKEHHQSRLREVLTALGDGQKNVLEITPHIRWEITARTWDEFPPAQKWFAFGETLAHVKYLEAQGIVRASFQQGMVRYALV